MDLHKYSFQQKYKFTSIIPNFQEILLTKHPLTWPSLKLRPQRKLFLFFDIGIAPFSSSLRKQFFTITGRYLFENYSKNNSEQS